MDPWHLLMQFLILESVGKIVIDIIESSATDNFENDLNTINSNGEINFLFDVPLLYFDNNNSVELGNSSILSLNLKMNMYVYIRVSIMYGI